MSEDNLEDTSTRNLLRSFSKRTSVSKTPYPEPLEPRQLRSRRKSKMKRDSSYAETPRTLLRKVQEEKSNRRSSFFDAASKQQKLVSRRRSKAPKQDSKVASFVISSGDDDDDEEIDDDHKSSRTASLRHSTEKSNLLPKKKSSAFQEEEKEVPFDYFLSPKGVLSSSTGTVKKTDDSKHRSISRLNKTKSIHQVSSVKQRMKDKYVTTSDTSDKLSGNDEIDSYSEVVNNISTQPVFQNSHVQSMPFSEQKKTSASNELSRYSTKSTAIISNVSVPYEHFPRVQKCSVKLTPLKMPKSWTVKMSQAPSLKQKSPKEQTFCDSSSSASDTIASELHRDASRRSHVENRTFLDNLSSEQKNALSSEKHSCAKFSDAEMHNMPSTSKKQSNSSRKQINEVSKNLLKLQISTEKSKKSPIWSEAISSTFHNLTSGIISEDELADDEPVDNELTDDKQANNELVDEDMDLQDHANHELSMNCEEHTKRSHIELAGVEENAEEGAAVPQERLQAAGPSGVATAVPPKRKYRKLERDIIPRMPDSFTCSIMEFYSDMTVARSCMPVINECLDEFWKQVLDTLHAHAKHAGRRRITIPDIELYLSRLGLCHDRNSLNALIEKYLPYELRSELIPIAMSKHAKDVLDFDDDDEDSDND